LSAQGGRSEQADQRNAATLVKSAKDAAARRRTAKELAKPLGGVLDTAAVLRGFLKSAKDATARGPTAKELAKPLGGALDTAGVLRGVLTSV
jgi:hypothetical protein